MTFLIQMLAHTPPYVFVLLAYLIWQGVLSLRTRRQSVRRMLIVPGLFIAMALPLPGLGTIRRHSADGGVARWAVGVCSAWTSDRAASAGG
jgi:hypothetical protein